MSDNKDTKIDQIVNDLVTDDTVAAQLKAKLHTQFDVKASGTSRAQPLDVDDSADDLWDNLPI